MKPRYTIGRLLQTFDTGENLSYLSFWGHTNKHNEPVSKACFSQWFESPFTVDEILYKTAEHWMMAQKALLFDDMETFEKIIQAEKPNDVKKLGRAVLDFTEESWNDHRFDIVKTGNIYKFTQHPPLADYLLSTGNKIIVEASPVDAIWGIGLSQEHPAINDPNYWRGLNLLGFALMEVHDFLSIGPKPQKTKPFI